VGTPNGVASDGETVISTADRYFLLKQVGRRRREARDTVVVVVSPIVRSPVAVGWKMPLAQCLLSDGGSLPTAWPRKD
jgi:hypothetical protein